MKFLKQVLSSVYLASLSYIVFFRDGRDQIRNHPLVLVPVRKKVHEFLSLNWHDSEFVLKFYANLIGNIILFVPFPVIIIWMIPRLSDKKVLVSCVIASILIEMTQYLFQRGVADIDDVLLNFLGSVTGLVLLKLFRRTKYTMPDYNMQE